MKKNPLSFQLDLNPDDFLPASEEEKQSQVIMRESVSFWKDGFRRLRKNKVAMVSIVVHFGHDFLLLFHRSIHIHTMSRSRVPTTLHRLHIPQTSRQESMPGNPYSHMSSVQIRWDVTTPSVL